MKVILDYDDVLNECNEEAIRKLNKEYGYCYSIGSNNRENMMIAKLWRKDQRLNMLIRSYRDGCVYYNNQETKRLLSYILSKY